MGFRAPRTVFKLVFTEPELEGLVVRASSTSVETFLKIMSMADVAETTDVKEAGAALETLFTAFEKMLVDWNLTDEVDNPLPATAASLMSLEFPFAMKIVNAWLTAAGDVSGPLAPGSKPGAPIREVSLPMETLSPSLVNS